MSAEKTQVRLGEERDQGLLLAIEGAGSIGKLARGLGISQPAVSAWTRIPADRVVAIEAFTGISRHLLRPDLYDQAALTSAIDPIDAVRAQAYLLLARLLLQAPDQRLLNELARLKGDATPFGLAMIGLARSAASGAVEAIDREFFTVFIGVGRGEAVPYGSYYQTGFLNERPLARVREDLTRFGVERRADAFEPEDHLGSLFEVMAGLIVGEFTADATAADRFFKRHIERWALRFFDDLAATPGADFYRAVAAVGQVFLSIESEAMTLPAAMPERVAV